jgi:hypothetical protein
LALSQPDCIEMLPIATSEAMPERRRVCRQDNFELENLESRQAQKSKQA